ncbi:SixA phosphatase family protein [Prauserella muralis]|uniref:Histidine phosphatase n=1 Tax=Prauserella muralis TaxID=588067 RepID=A0A2V4AM98_9PSEU|nr:histidine phosphatase family protein [Prauserella muralis]PXY20719.1 histidine phosphatase [Prauserella muralis]TWE29726.1 phosphohistidine phosphatase [Prauserella muralis]
MRRELVILRHAKSDWPEGVPDEQRPLAPRGHRDAPAAGRWLREHVPAFDLVLCSPATRARQTWQLVRTELGGDPELRQDERLYGATLTTLTSVVRELPDEAGTVLLVGHNPGLEDLVTALSGEECELRTASIAVLTGSGSWAGVTPGWASLDHTAKPRG